MRFHVTTAAACLTAVAEAWQPQHTPRSPAHRQPHHDLQRSEVEISAAGLTQSGREHVEQQHVLGARQPPPLPYIPGEAAEKQLLRKEETAAAHEQLPNASLDSEIDEASEASEISMKDIKIPHAAVDSTVEEENELEDAKLEGRSSLHPRGARFISSEFPELFGSWWQAKVITQWDGILEVIHPIESQTDMYVAKEQNRACVQELGTVQCMSKLGSYGLNRLYTYPYYMAQDMGWERPNWMDHQAVRSKRFADLTLPMSHASSAYELEGSVATDLGKGESAGMLTQTYDVYQQLKLGVRALDFEVAYNNRTKHIYCAHKLLTVSLARVLLDVKNFLEEYPTEIVVLDLRKAKLDPTEEFGTVEPIEKEMKDPKKLPGQMVHNVVIDILGKVLADYRKIAGSAEPGFADLENPTVGELVKANARAFYFWEGQQVLCPTMKKCLKTPGWQRAPLDTSMPESNFAFGPPMVMGTREPSELVADVQFSVGSNNTWMAPERVMEPLCMNPSRVFTESEEPSQLINKVKTFTDKMHEVISRQAPFCYPPQTELPALHTPTLMNRVDAWLDVPAETREELADLLRNNKNVFVQGEPLNSLSLAERVNYFLLLWYMSRDNKQLYGKANMIAMDQVHPVLIGRLVAAMQEEPECGYAVVCKDSGSCFAQDLHEEGGKCKDARNSERFLRNFMAGSALSYETRYTLFVLFWVAVKWTAYSAFTVKPTKRTGPGLLSPFMGLDIDEDDSDEE